MRAEVPSLNRVTVKPDCSMDGLEAPAADEADGGVEAAVALAAHLRALLVTFIGEPLTLRLVRQSWDRRIACTRSSGSILVRSGNLLAIF